jgi:hypothetical protein
MSAKETPAKQKEWDVTDQHHQTDGPAREEIDQLCDAAHPARSQVRRDEKYPQTHRLNQRAKRDKNEILNSYPIFFHGAILLCFFHAFLWYNQYL